MTTRRHWKRERPGTTPAAAGVQFPKHRYMLVYTMLHKAVLVNSFLADLSAHGLRPVRHGRWIGIRGAGLRCVPAEVWSDLIRYKPQLLRLLPDTLSPFRSRQRRAAQ
jgi:hypothetical protein